MEERKKDHINLALDSRTMLDTLDRGRLSIAAMGLGCAQGAYEIGLKYARERQQFGKPISTFQVNAFKLADMHVEIEAARNLLYKFKFIKTKKIFRLDFLWFIVYYYQYAQNVKHSTS